MSKKANQHCDSRLELALEGERLCRLGNCEQGVKYLEEAVEAGINDPKTLTAVYGQLGNAYFILQDYAKSLEFHTHNVTVARNMGDRQEEAKASGNVGNTLKVLGKYEEAFTCCERYLDISRELGDRVNEARALYSLGNVFHAKGKNLGKSSHKDPGEYPTESQEALQNAICYYEANLSIVRELDDKVSLGRTYGNLGNTHYLLGNFHKAISYHEERLSIAKEFGDLSAERRACNNLGNAYMFLGEFKTATDLYKKALELAEQLNDRVLEAQACYSLGNTYNLLREYDLAIEYHTRHLKIAQELRDRIGEGKACWSLSIVYTSIKNMDLAMFYAKKHMEISKEVDDPNGYALSRVNLSDLKILMSSCDDASFKRANSCREKSDTDDDLSVGSRTRRRSMENLELVQLTPNKNKPLFRTPDISSWKRQFKASKALSQLNDSKKYKNKKQLSIDSEEENFFDLLSKYQSRRIDDQRCSSSVLVGSRPTSSSIGKKSLSSEYEDDDDKENQVGAGGSHCELQDEFLDLLAGIQGSRMNDQRADPRGFLPPSLTGRRLVMGGQYNHSSPSHSVGGASMTSGGTEATSSSEEQFLDNLMRSQAARLDNQRTVMPNHGSASTVPEEEFFSLIQRYQCRRLDGQRSTLPPRSEPRLESSKRLENNG